MDVNTISRIHYINNKRCSLDISNDPDGNWHVKVGTQPEIIGRKLKSLIREAYGWLKNLESQKSNSN